MIMELKWKIKYKFGTIGRFIELSGLPKNKVLATISGRISARDHDDWIRKIKKAINETKPDPDPNLITNEQREFIRKYIRMNYDTSAAFCAIHDQFNNTLISNIINGKKKRIDIRVEKLMIMIRKQSMKMNYPNGDPISLPKGKPNIQPKAQTYG